MKKIRKSIIAILTVIAMFASTGVGVFATEGAPDQSGTPTAVSDELEGTDVEQPSTEEGEPETDVTEPTTTEPDQAEQPMRAGLAGLSAYPGYNTVVLMWTATEGKTYELTYEKAAPVDPENPEAAAVVPEVTTPYTVTGLDPATEYVFTVKSTDGAERGTVNATTADTELAAAVPKLYSSRNELQIEFEVVEGADAYIVERAIDSKAFEYYITLSPKIDNDYDKYKDGKCIWRNAKKVSNTHKYRYRVTALQLVKDEGGNFVVKDESQKLNNYNRYVIQQQAAKSKATSKKTYVKPMYLNVKPKMNRKLTSKDTYKGKHKSYTFKKGVKIKCYGFTSGCYYFKKKISGHSYTFRISRINVYGQTASYVGNHKNPSKGNYNRHEAELFVNSYMDAQKHYDSTGAGKNYCIWVSYYTQHLFVFKRSHGNWVLAKDTNDKKFPRDNWECSSGKASTPSYTGKNRINSNRATKMKGIPWWNGYHGSKDKEGNFNGIHGKQSSYVLGEPRSHACIRNANKNAKLIYDAYIVGAAVICY